MKFIIDERRLKKDMKFKKIISVLASAVMISSTIGFAAAASFPEPFVSGGTANGAIVYGTAGDINDLYGAIDIQENLQALVTTASSDAGSASASGESVKFEKATDKLNIGDNLTTVRSIAIDEDDMPTILAEGTYSNAENNDYAYEQKIELWDEIQFGHFADNDYNNKDPALGLKIAKNKPVLNYTLDWTKSPEDDTNSGDDLDDFEDTEIEILGKSYDITTAVNTSDRVKLTLMGGAVKDTLNLNDVKTYTANGKTYEVTLSYVDSSNYCKFEVDGESTSKILKGSTDKLSDGTYIGVADVDYSTGAVTEIMRCKFYLGADKIELEDTKEVKINDNSVDKLKTFFSSTAGNPFKLDKMVIEWKADTDLFVVEEGDSITMPGFGSVKLSSGGLTAPEYEVTKVRGASNEDITLTTTLKSGETTIQILAGNSSGNLTKIGGYDSGEGLATANGTGTSLQIIYNVSSGADGHQYFVATYYDGSKSGSSYLVEVSDIDDADGADFRDVITGIDLATNIRNDTGFEIGDATLTTGKMSEDGEWVQINATGSNTYFDRIITNAGLMIMLPVNSSWKTLAHHSPFVNLSAHGMTNYTIYMQEEDKDGTIGAGQDINVTVKPTASSNSYNLEATISDDADNVCNVIDGAEADLEDKDDDNLYICYVQSDLGTKILYDTDPDEDTVDIYYPGSQSYGNIYIAESDSVITPATTVGAGGGQILVVKDNEVDSVASKNLVVVGGSCINTVAAKILGSDTPLCEAAFTDATEVSAGQYIIKTIASPYAAGDSGKVAMLVAGYNAADTTNAVAKALEGVTSDVGTSQVYPITTA